MANDKTPLAYGQEYANTLLSRWNAAVGDAVRRYAPQVWPGVPPEALLGFTTIGTQTDDTGLPPVNNSFHEIGYFQTEAGPKDGPSPNPDPSAPNNSWGKLANDSRVTALLGHPATMEPNAWKTDINAQTAVGLVNILNDANNVAAGIPASAQPDDPSSLWRVGLGFNGFSAGVGGARASITRYASALSGVPDSRKFAAWIDAILRDYQAGTLPGSGGHHGNPGYDALRVWQKLAAGYRLAQQTGGSTGWFDTGFGLGTPDEAAAQQGLLAAAYKTGSVGSIPGITSQGSTPTGIRGLIPSSAGVEVAVGAVVVAALVGGVVWYFTQDPKR